MVDMYCFHPIVITRGDREMEVPCGKCPACRRHYQLEWIIRLTEEHKHSEKDYFVTLTYEDSAQPSFDKKRCQKFLDRLQHRAKYHGGATMKYFFVSEFCPTTGRPHHHALLFLDSYIDNFSEFIASCWPFGFITVGDVTERRINYVTGYCLKKQQHGVDWSDMPSDMNPDKCRFMSKGLGLAYLSDNILNYHKQGLVKTYSANGSISQLPRYYKDKIFDEDDKKMIMLTNRCYVRAQRRKELKRFGLQEVTSFDSRKGVFYRHLTTISNDPAAWRSLADYRMRQDRRREAYLELWNNKMIHQ